MRSRDLCHPGTIDVIEMSPLRSRRSQCSTSKSDSRETRGPDAQAASLVLSGTRSAMRGRSRRNREWFRGVARVRCRPDGRLLSRLREHGALGSDCCSGLYPGRIVRRRRRLLTAASCWPEQAPPRSRFARGLPGEAATRRPQRQLHATPALASSRRRSSLARATRRLALVQGDGRR
jgi:hypothetical protein